MSRNFLLIKTDLFVFGQDERDIDQWLVGADCAGWFYARLLPINPILRKLEPIMEDWGWTFAVSVGDVEVDVNLWAYSIENCWLFGVKARNRVLRRKSADAMERAQSTVSGAMDRIAASDARIQRHKWFSDNPFELQLTEF